MFVLSALLLFLAAEPAAPAAAPATPPAADAKKERVICINVVPTGSIMAKKVCHTRKRWKEIEEAQRRQADRILDPAERNEGGRE